ncbi:MAG: antibiotic biosynthesis monooxygenase family protein [Syntrophorhabdus sp.]
MNLISFRIIVPSKKHPEVAKILTRMAEKTRVESGCLACNIYRDIQDKRALVLEEIWNSDEEIINHLRTEEFRHVLLVAEIALEKPQVRFCKVIPGDGMQRIEKLRGLNE